MFKHMPEKLSLILLLICCIPSDVNGLSYDYISDGYFTSIHILTVDPKEHVIMPAKASGDDVARETVTALANSYGAVAAVNGGFWKLSGEPAGILKINHHWYGTPTKPRGAIGWSSNRQQVLIDKLLTNHRLHDTEDDSEIEVIPVSTPPYTTSEEWEELEHIVGGTPVLVNNGNIVEDFTSEQTFESFLVNRHPRTAVGIKKNGEWVFVVVDGHFDKLFDGMTVKELAELMLELGCVEALNLDGGGSSTMVLEGTVINEPGGKIQEDDKYVEAVSDAILIFSADPLIH